MIIGLTGGSGTGKTCAAAFFAKKGYAIIDFDIISRDVTAPGTPCLKELADTYGKSILTPDGALDRKALGAIVFGDAQKLATLNSITHKYILQRSQELTEMYKDRHIIYDAPLLFEAGLEKKCDYVICVLADRDKRINRICRRDGLSHDAAKKRIDSQRDDKFFEENCDFCVYNNFGLDYLERQLQEVTQKIAYDSP